MRRIRRPRPLVRPALIGSAFLVPAALAVALGTQQRAVPGWLGTAPPAQASAATGAITGVVRFESTHPQRQPVPVFKDRRVCGVSKPSQKFLVGPQNRGLKNVLITVDGVTGGRRPSPQPTVTIELRRCRHVPHFQVAEMGPQGIELRVLNRDGILHNIHAYLGKETLFNVAQPGFRKELRWTLTTPGIITLRCDVHRWMSAHVVLLKDQPYYAATDEKGGFTIADVPPGTYTLRAWHEGLGEMERSVTVRADQETVVRLVIRDERWPVK